MKALHQLGHDRSIHLKPKAHYLCHVVRDELSKSPALNPWSGATWRDEDYIGKILRMAKASHGRTIQRRVIELYLGRLWGLLRT
jgi:hypothetical protein